MLLLAERCVGTSAVIENGQSLIVDWTFWCVGIISGVNNEPVVDVIGIPFSNGGLVDDDGEDVGPTVLHGIAEVGTGILESRYGGLTVPDRDLCR